MSLLYGLLILMLAGSICLLAIPFLNASTLSLKYFWVSALFVILFSFGLYQFNNDHAALIHWLAQGEKHYQLQQEVSDLGGFAGMIKQIKKKVAANPDDAQGWFILGKLYLANQNYDEAKEALGNAVRLRPNDQEIRRYYDRAQQVR